MRAHLGHNISQFLRVSGPFESTWCASQLKWESFPLYLFSKCWWHRKDLCQEWSLSHSHWDLDLFQAASTTSSGNFPIKSLHHKMGRITALYFPLDPKFAFQRACIDARAASRRSFGSWGCDDIVDPEDVIDATWTADLTAWNVVRFKSEGKRGSSGTPSERARAHAIIRKCFK